MSTRGHHGLLIAGADIWSPANLAVPPRIWLDDQSQITLSSGACSQWNDRSGNAYHFTQGTLANMPSVVTGAGGKRAIRFDGSNDRLQNNSAGARGIFTNAPAMWALLLAKRVAADVSGMSRFAIGVSTASTSNTRFSIIHGTAGSANLRRLDARRLDADSTVQTSAGTTSTATAIELYHCDCSAGTINVRVDGNATASGSFASTGNVSNTAAAGPVSIGSDWANNNPTNTEFSAILMGNAPITLADQQRMEGWLAWRFGVVGALPGGHPYKSAPPTV